VSSLKYSQPTRPRSAYLRGSIYKSSLFTFVFGVIFLVALVFSPGLYAVERESVEVFTVATRTVPGLRLFTARYNMQLAELIGKLEGLATRLASNQIRAGGEKDGPLHILVESGPETSKSKQQTLVAFPTRGNPRSSGRNRAISTKPFRCTYFAYEGPVDGIATALDELARITVGADYQLNGQTRLVFSCDGNCTKEHISVELQLGIE